ncbi:MAG: hypothetical protein KGH98_04145 [Candidatus Micrarchaeota archaeon]|nr:hypothetical protein [Candidatus Micrarchaeota archaeon]
MKYDQTLLIKIDKKTKERMKEAGINWSEEIRRFITAKLDRWEKVSYALEQLKELRKMTKDRGAKGFDSTAFIRKTRDERYGRKWWKTKTNYSP